MQELMAIYKRYCEEYEAVRKKASPVDGMLGFGADPRKDACHDRFYESVAQWVKDFLAGDPDSKTACEAVNFILTSSVEYRGEPEYWFMYAVHGLCRDLVAVLAPSQCAALQQYYDANFPKRDRMPAHAELYKLLRKGAQKKEK